MVPFNIFRHYETVHTSIFCHILGLLNKYPTIVIIHRIKLQPKHCTVQNPPVHFYGHKMMARMLMTFQGQIVLILNSGRLRHDFPSIAFTYVCQ